MRVFRIVFCSLSWLAVYSWAAEDEEKEKKDWELSISLGNSVGIGSFVLGYSQTPSWGTSLIFNPSYQIPSFLDWPRVTLSLNQVLSIWWLESYNTSITDSANRIALGDLSLGASMSPILKSESAGFSLGTNLSFLLPVSRFSQNIHRVVGFNPSMLVSWSKWGFRAAYTPAILAWIHSNSDLSVPCLEMPAAMINPSNSDTNLDQLIQGLSIARYDNEHLGKGHCLVSGRQNLLSLNNSLSAGWSYQEHSFDLSLIWVLNFLRPLKNNPDLKSQYASHQNFNEATVGRIGYTYSVPIDTNLSFSVGVLSVQASYDQAGRLTFPFFDFVTPSNNQTQLFFQTTVGI